MYYDKRDIESTTSIISNNNNRCNHNKKRQKKKKKGPHQEANPNKGEDITFMFGMKFDDDDDECLTESAGGVVSAEHSKYTSIPEMKTLMAVFPSIPPETIYAILEDNFGNIESTAEELQCQMDALTEASRTPKAARKAKPQGEDVFPRLDSARCRTAAVTPRSSSPTRTAKSEWGSLQAPPPAVVAAPTPTSGTGLKLRMELTAAGLLNYKELAKKYTFLEESVLHEIFINTGQSYTMTVLRLWEMFPDEMEASGSPPPSPTSSPAPAASATVAKIAKKPNERGITSICGGSAPCRRPHGGDTVYTTEDFIEPVLEARRAIENLKRSRNVTIAYKGGNVKTNVPADEFRTKAEDLLARGAEEAARIGAAIITRQKGFVDFHHLTVNETLEVLERLMERLAEYRHSHGVLMVTGLGKHSSDGRAHLMPAVEQWLSQRRIRYTKKTGSIFVRL